MGLLTALLRKKKTDDDPWAVVSFAACFAWVNTWLFFPFMATAAVWHKFGILSAAAFWLGLGVAVPSLRQQDRVRWFISQMRFWIDGKEIIGSVRTGGKPALHCHHPHGAAAINGCSKGGLDMKIRAVVAPLCFRMPLCRQLMELMGAISCEKKAFQKYMESGEDFAILPGGVEEVTLADTEHERVYLKRRKGFVKYALEMGYDLVPIYHFGETQLFDVIWPQTAPAMVRLRLLIAQKTQIALGIGLGCRWMPNLPKRGQKCVTVIGERIDLPRITSPSSEDVDRYHELYVHKLIELFNANRHRLPACADKELEIW